MTDAPQTEDRRAFFAIAQPRILALAQELEAAGLSVDQIGDSLMSGAVGIAVAVSGKTRTAAALLGIARRVIDGAYDGAAEIETGTLN